VNIKKFVVNRTRYAAPSQPEKLEQALYQPFAGVLHNDVDGKPFGYP
jgi:hypothetical protein